MRRNNKFLAAALGVGALVGLAIPLGAAVASSSPADPYFNFAVQNPGTLVAKGAGATVTLQVTCFPETFTSGISVSVTQRVGGNRIATGFGFVNGLNTCDGFPHTVPITVTANQNAFRIGPALVTADTFACTPAIGCSQFTDQSTIDLKK